MLPFRCHTEYGWSGNGRQLSFISCSSFFSWTSFTHSISLSKSFSFVIAAHEIQQTFLQQSEFLNPEVFILFVFTVGSWNLQVDKSCFVFICITLLYFSFSCLQSPNPLLVAWVGHRDWWMAGFPFSASAAMMPKSFLSSYSLDYKLSSVPLGQGNRLSSLSGWTAPNLSSCGFAIYLN